MDLKKAILILFILLSFLGIGTKAQSLKSNIASPPELEGFGKYLRSLVKEGKNAEVANWFFTQNKNLNSSKYYMFASKFYEKAKKSDSAAISLNLALNNGISDPNIVEKEMAAYNLLNTNNFKEIIAQSEYGFVLEESENSQTVSNKPVSVTFECGSCKIGNKFAISGTEDHMFKKVTFPFKHKLKPGKYEMTYWQNTVQQVHLPFSISPKSDNVITVKE